MTLRNWFFNWMIEEGKRRLWAIALSCLVFFFSLPVVAVFLSGTEYNPEFRKIRFTEDIVALLSYDNGWMIFIMMVLAVVLGITGYAYLNSRKKVDFYHSIPIKRGKLFSVTYVVGVLIVAVPYLVCLLFSVLIGWLGGADGRTILGVALTGWAYQMLSFLIVYTTSIICVMLTGNTIVALLGFGVINGFFPLLLNLLDAYAYTWWKTFWNFQPMTGWVTRTSPIALYIAGLVEDITIGRICSRLAVSVVLILIAAFLHKKRPSQAAGKAMAFYPSQPVIRIPLTIVSAMSGLIFFHTLGHGFGWSMFGLLTGGMICHCVIEIIYHFDFKKLFSHKIQLAVSLAVAFLGFSLFRWDILGYDSWIPKEEKLESVAVYASDVDQWMDYGVLVNTENSGEQEVSEYIWNWVSEDAYLLEHMELEQKNLALELAKTWIEQEKSWAKEDGPQERVYVEYRLTDGRKVHRCYQIPKRKMSQVFAGIYQDNGYKTGRYPVLSMKPENVEEVRVKTLDQEAYLSDMESQETDMSVVVEGYQRDLMLATLQDFNQIPLGEIKFLDHTRVAAEKEERSNYSYQEFYPVYPSFTNTLKSLEDRGIDLEQWNEREIKYISLYGLYDFEGTYQEIDSEWIPEIKDVLLYNDYVRYTNYYYEDMELQADVCWVDKKGKERIDSYYVIPGETADRLQESIQKENENK